MPLLTTRDGRKMGKSASGAVWLNGDKLSPYDFWQFWRNCDDADVGRFLALFSELPLDEVARLSALEGAELNQAKIILANAATALAHGEQAARDAEATARALFTAQETDAELPQLSVSAEDLAGGLSLTDLLLRHNLQPSRSAIRRMASGGGLLLTGERQSNPDQPLQAWQLGRRLSLGKKRHYLLQAR